MPKFMIHASEEVFYMKEVKADDYAHAIEVFGQTITNNDIVDGQGFTIEQVEEIENA
jgi:hypothetical protein